MLSRRLILIHFDASHDRSQFAIITIITILLLFAIHFSHRWRCFGPIHPVLSQNRVVMKIGHDVDLRESQWQLKFPLVANRTFQRALRFGALAHIASSAPNLYTLLWIRHGLSPQLMSIFIKDMIQFMKLNPICKIFHVIWKNFKFGQGHEVSSCLISDYFSLIFNHFTFSFDFLTYI